MNDAKISPNITEVTKERPVPVIVTFCPPAAGPLFGLMLVIIGLVAAGRVVWSVVFGPAVVLLAAVWLAAVWLAAVGLVVVLLVAGGGGAGTYVDE
ncbi:MAG: hypothetical protein A3C15_03525 [Candidatus Magasanikbacteria bacterium RIFCSPHIGHO2_02_FULL_50_9b]|uniref:Uncharacterized protein n=1 Tax=Candidatus Magasanikbacteria bacterium RIFCSPHIGHO2_02_FULL_50_9b TaxID=1798682 RepID=A0A1F6M9F0_9BACT|nr:MAG: hypothetical protein A3C15_03525 [Candidatus Magasanikbacteria bacterium RIFCSPHIGHO2_02_FULL_50_9b]